MMKIALLALTVQGAMAGLAGGWNPKPVDDAQVRLMAQFAEPHLQGDINHTAYFRLRSIDSAKAQVVSGMNYELDVTLEETTTDAASYNPGDTLTAASPAGTVKCTIRVYDQPWTSTRELKSKTCSELQY